MLRSLGVSVSTACHRLLSRQINGHTSTYHSYYFQGFQIPIAMYHRIDSKDGVKAYVQKENWKKGGRILTVRNPEGKLLTFSVTSGGKLSLEVEGSV
jgi:hypothetical protein